jgi:hypothetical protein
MPNSGLLPSLVSLPLGVDELLREPCMLATDRFNFGKETGNWMFRLRLPCLTPIRVGLCRMRAQNGRCFRVGFPFAFLGTRVVHTGSVPPGKGRRCKRWTPGIKGGWEALGGGRNDPNNPKRLVRLERTTKWTYRRAGKYVYISYASNTKWKLHTSTCAPPLSQEYFTCAFNY